ncbi:MAG: beta-N-acetylhexosaminidase [Bacteroidales bacterium]|nr:beta-N-acetylhexosaminidase [Bacteroidales bacterium]
MKKTLIAILASLMLASPALKAVEIVPAPVSMKESKISVEMPKKVTVYAVDKDLKKLVKTWSSTLKKNYKAGVYDTPAGLKRIVSDVKLPAVKFTKNAKKAFVALEIDATLPEEAYTLEISAEGAKLCGGSVKGVWWGLQTLTQVLVQSAPSGKIGGLSIQDQPHFAYRGAMLDCCRHFYSVDEVKGWIDMIALHKLNTFHWHLTEDQGWRIEIKKYPLLTKVGSIRKRTVIGLYKTSKEFDENPYGGYYTQKQIKDIVAYAADRQITIIPEIEMPGHAVAALASYPYLGCTGGPYEVRQIWGISKETFCLGKESTYEFLQDVLDEVCELFPSEYIHIGGDEAPRDAWKACPVCQAKMKAEGLKNEAELQSYQLKRIEAYLNSKGRKVIGWDEILEGGVTPSATIMSWRGPKGGIAAAKQGNDVVMTPNSYFYLDYYQTKEREANGEPLAIGGHVNLRKCYAFDPYDQLTAEEGAHIKGVQANTWCEYICTMDHVEHMDLPRFAALSEVCWSESRGDYDEFVKRVQASLVPLYEYKGYVYAPYAFKGIE